MRYDSTTLGALVLVLLAAAACSDAGSGESSNAATSAPPPAGIGDGEVGSNGAGGPGAVGGAAMGAGAPAAGEAPRVDSDSSDSVVISPGSPATPAAPMMPGATPSPADPSAGGVTSAEGAAIAADGVFIDSPPIVEPGGGEPQTAPGTLTAGAWDDNLNFSRFLDYREEVMQMGMAGVLPFEESEHIEANERSGIPAERQTLDIALVFDTTGSMGDELRYLQTEFSALSQEIRAAYPESEQRWALIAYRDVGDAYEARWFDFREDPQEYEERLMEQSADGGGDFPEAPERAFEAMNQLAWRADDSTARLAFWVADAPHHAERAEQMADAIRESAALDIHVYPVASSGIDEVTELSMRSAAQVTLGRYLFLTDDSGVGGAHKEPSIPCYFVTKLDDANLRMVDIELSGVYREPLADEIVRTGGDPQDRACTMSSGEELFAY